MGANTSSLLSEEIEEMARESDLTPKEIKRLYKRFQKLDRNQSGTLEPEELTMIPELAMNPLVPRIVTFFENVNFREFVKLLSVFAENADHEEKLKFAFRFFDVDNDGYLNTSDLNEILHLLCGDNLKAEELDEIVQIIIQDADMDKDGKLSFVDFKSSVTLSNMTDMLSIVF
mmetsp:Transcript_18592/g.32277  ORF Transcript_18592/g.32277 Transcript_18592/m.32277 type:complete len:173 (+) Transcript_18592:213-731(+)|eukprot:CAMPEP_0184698924 /NCGR_PEP_ID=MMETSP0313-20130426/5364_1 /TAXON_ID=2792 /ORGANISM="Porphyridium aerugineum, Strain SAG 1380-2" /LENGTH=172 /DNA_ID=CAMNT_0027157925 /DNA_START=213 /DNA_END=731 /DNA_ORIENTATION=-